MEKWPQVEYIWTSGKEAVKGLGFRSIAVTLNGRGPGEPRVSTGVQFPDSGVGQTQLGSHGQVFKPLRALVSSSNTVMLILPTFHARWL